MKFQTLSLVAGTNVCQARCPFCVSRLTGLDYLETKPEAINVRNLRKTLKLANVAGVTSVIMTGKGEPTLYPEHIDTYLDYTEIYNFPFIELQTNGGILAEDTYKGHNTTEMLQRWYDKGLTTLLLSNVGPDPELNHQIYFPHKKSWIDIKKLVDKCKKIGIGIRLTTVGIQGGVDSPAQLDKLIEWANWLEVEQLTWRPVNKPTLENSEDKDIHNWVVEHGLKPEQVFDIQQYVKEHGKLLYNLVHGAQVYDLKGRNFCITNCLTNNAEEETIRQLIFYPNGKLYTDWVYSGSVLL